MKNKKPKWNLILIISLCVLLGLLFITIVLYNNETVKIKYDNLNLTQQINNKDVELIQINTEKEITDTKNSNLEKDLNSNLDFFTKHNLIILHITKSDLDFTAANNLLNIYRYYEDLTDSLYSEYNLTDMYDYEHSKSILEESIKSYDDCITNILKINKLFNELTIINNTYWVTDVNLRKKQINQLNELCISGKELSKSLLNQGHAYYELNYQNAYITELNKYNNELVPKYNTLLENYNRTLKEINIHLNAEIYYT